MESYRDKILHSGIFRLNGAKPVGLFALYPKTKRIDKQSIQRHSSLNDLIDDLTTLTQQYAEPTLALEEAYRAFIQVQVDEIRARLAAIIPLKTVEPELTKLENKVKKVMRQRFPQERFKRTLWASRAKRNALTVGFMLHAFISRGIGRNDTDLLHYVTYILRASKLEPGSQKTAFKRIAGRHNENIERITLVLGLYRKLRRPTYAVPPEMFEMLKRPFKVSPTL